MKGLDDWLAAEQAEPELYSISVCVDCAHLEANGEPYQGNADGAFGPYGWAEASRQIDTVWSGWRLDLDDDDTFFSKSPCDWCASPYHGDRFPAKAWQPERSE